MPHLSSFDKKQPFSSGLILLPVVALYFIINILRNNSSEPAGILVIDAIFFVSLTAGALLIRKGKYPAAVYMIIIIVTALTIMGHLVRSSIQIETGANSFSVLMFAVMVFTAMFGTRRILVMVSLIFLILTISLYVFASIHAQPSVQFHLLSGTLNSVIVTIMILCLSYQNSIITGSALDIAQQELEKNAELNRTDDQGYWKQIESYIRDHSEAKFSHGICPDCAKKLYPEEFAELFPEKQ